MAVIRSKFSKEELAQQKILAREEKERKKRMSSPGGTPPSAEGAPKRMAILALIGAVFWIALFAFQLDLKKRMADKPLPLPKVEPVSDAEGDSLGAKFFTGMYGGKSVAMSLGEINSLWVPKSESVSTEPGRANTGSTHVYLMPAKGNILIVISLPLEAFLNEEKHLNGTILLVPTKVAGESSPLLKISKMQINKVDLTKGEVKSVRNMINLAYGFIGIFLRAAQNYPQLGMPTMDPAKKGDITETIRARIEGDTIRFNPSEEDNYNIQGTDQ